MAGKVKKKNPMEDPPGEKLSLLSFKDSATTLVGTSKTETAQQFTYPGWDKLVAGLEPTTPEIALERASADLADKFAALTAPHSPLTPEEAGVRALPFEAGVNLGYAGLVALVTGIEAAGFGQLETPAMMLPHAPIVEAGIRAAADLRYAYLEASIIKGLRYLANSQHQPTIIPPDVLTDAYNMGYIDADLYSGQMTYHGYTPARSGLIAAASIRMPDIGSILELRRRNIITDKGVYDWLRLMKIPPMTADAIGKLYAQNPEAYRLAIAAAKGIIPEEVYFGAMSWWGLDKNWSGVYRDVTYEQPSVGMLAELLWRGIINADTFKLALHRSSIAPFWHEGLLALTAQIPTAQDLVTMVVREAFDPKYVTPAPDVFAEYMAKKGFSREWSDRYWTMHWVPIPLTQAYENLHRGYWTKEQFLEALRIADLHPMWREAVYNVAFLPPSIRELGYGFDVGAYTREDIVKYRRWGGLSLDDAEKSATAMVMYRTEAERNALRTEYMYLYGRGKITIEEYKSKLIELITNPIALELWLERAKAYKERVTKETTPEEPPSVTRSTVQWLFENGLRDERWFKSALADLGFTDDSISAFLDQSKKRISDAEAKAEKVEYRELTVTQIRDLYRLRKIKAEELPAEFQKLNYSLDDAKRISDLMVRTEALPAEPRKLSRTEIVNLYEIRLLGVSDTDMRSILSNIIMTEGPKSPTKALYGEYIALGYSDVDAVRLTVWTAIDVTLPTLKAVYAKGWISATQLFNSLVEIGIPKEKADEIMMTIIKASQPERTAPEKDLTKAEIIKGAKVGILSIPQASELLQGIGYDQNEAMYLLYINAVVSRGDPETYWEMRKVVEQQKKAKGEKYVEIPDDLILLELRIKEAKAKLEQLKAQRASEEEIGAQAVVLGGLETNMRVIIAKLKLQ